MLRPCLCGSGTFLHDEEDETFCGSPLSSPKKFKRGNKNPYSERGLDKFSALVADLDERRQKIYSQMNPHDIAFLRFVYGKTDEVVPVVVKVKNKEQKSKSAELNSRHVKSKSEIVVEKSASESTAAMEERKQNKLDAGKKAEKKVSWNMQYDMLRHPSFYVPVVIILILLFLTVFGRSAASLCTCILWYIVPTLSDSSELRKSMMKENYARGMSEKIMASDGLLSPRSTISGPLKDKSQKKLSHQKSW